MFAIDYWQKPTVGNGVATSFAEALSQWTDPQQLIAAASIFAVRPRVPVQVTEKTIEKALRNSKMKTIQGRVSQPMVERYVRMLESGSAPPPIKVAGGVMVEGNHRYVAGSLVGKKPPQVPGNLPRSQVSRVQPIQKTKVDPVDWGGH